MKPPALVTLASLATALLSATATAQLPPGAPPGTYNASATTSGAFTGDDSLYAGNAGFESIFTGSGTIISYKKITVTTQSILWRVTGNGTYIGDQGIGGLEWEITVDPCDGSIATANPTNGLIVEKTLAISDSIFRGTGFIGGPSEDWEVLLNADDGGGFTLDPGEYYVAVWADSSPFTNGWLWNELSTTGVPSDIFYADALHAPGEFDIIQGQSALGGHVMQTGNLAFDVWMTPLASVCAGDCDGSGVVDFNDLVAMLFEFGEPGAPDACDADASGEIDFNDLVTALFAFGACP